MWGEVLVSYQSLCMYLLTQTGGSIKIPNRIVGVYIFSALLLIIIYMVSTCQAHSLEMIFFLWCLLLLCHCCGLVAMSLPTLLQPQGL